MRTSKTARKHLGVEDPNRGQVGVSHVPVTERRRPQNASQKELALLESWEPKLCSCCCLAIVDEIRSRLR
jgi:hypothetical protein